MNDEAVENLIEDYKKYAEENGFKLNSDKKIVEVLIKKLLENEEKYGERYCPCRLITGDCEKDKKNICPCLFIDSEIRKQGHCHCDLFVK